MQFPSQLEFGRSHLKDLYCTKLYSQDIIIVNFHVSKFREIRVLLFTGLV